MAMGMSLDEFWNCSPRTYRYYIEAEIERLEQRNSEMWLQGLYVFRALEAALHNQPAFPSENITPVPYLKEPIRLTPPSEEEVAEQEAEEQEKLVAQLTAIQKAWESKHGRH